MALLLALLWAGGCERQPLIAPLEPQDKIVAFGDSLTWGTGAPREASYPQTLASLLGIEVVNAGVPGELSAEGRRRLPGVLAEYRPALVILCHGGNDMLRRRSLDKLAENLRVMIESCRNAGADVVLVGVPQLGFTLEPPPLYDKIAAEYDIPYADDILADLLADRDFKSDTIHPNAAGYRRLARVLADLIVEAQSP
ncbi:MAG: arylesterase [Desulfuromonadales bacterium]|nr:arylesterase [Desulfuromonadales bacterium]NIS43183.1 arylesterase [Desulfuromonadales bacterium]